MAKVVVSNIDPGIDGEYDLATVDEWTHDDWHLVKKLTGLKLGDFLRADEDGEADADVILALAVVSCQRAGKRNPHVLLKQGRLGDIELTSDVEAEVEELGTDEEDDAGPPVLSTGSDVGSGSDTTPNGKTTSELSDPSAIVPFPTGVRI